MFILRELLSATKAKLNESLYNERFSNRLNVLTIGCFRLNVYKYTIIHIYLLRATITIHLIMLPIRILAIIKQNHNSLYDYANTSLSS